MNNHTPDPYLAQTGFEDEASDLDDEFEFEGVDVVDDELEIEEERARER